MTNKPIYVTEPSLPPLDDFIPYLEQIWDSRILTNNGPFHQQLENALCEYLDVPYISLFVNGTIALVTALKALDVQGEVITTPYTFVATTHALKWNGLTPVFVDIDPVTLNLDPEKIEDAVTEKTTAIFPVHVYGQPCNVDAIDAIAKKHNLSVLYDAAHAFGVRCHCGSVLNHGDLSVLSFHATKVFNTFEGGAIVSHDIETKTHIDHLKNFGFANEISVTHAGINGKMSEVNAAFGLLQLKYLETALARRKDIDSTYRDNLSEVNDIVCLGRDAPDLANHSYFPILVGRNYHRSRDVLYRELKHLGINVRRYFYPLTSNFPLYKRLPSAHLQNLPVANDTANRVLCLPIHPNLEVADITRIANAIRVLAS